MSHSRPLFYQLKTLNIHDMVYVKRMVFMYNVYNKLLPANSVILQKINACHNHNVRMKNCNYKMRLPYTCYLDNVDIILYVIQLNCNYKS